MLPTNSCIVQAFEWFFVTVNQCGVEKHGGSIGETRSFGHSRVVDPREEILTEAEEGPSLLHADMHLSIVQQVRVKLSAWNDRRTDLF